MEVRDEEAVCHRIRVAKVVSDKALSHDGKSLTVSRLNILQLNHNCRGYQSQ